MVERKSGGILVLFLVALIIILSSSFVFAAGPKYGGTLNVGVRVPQFGYLDVRYGTLETMIPSSGMIYDPFFNWGPDGYKSQVPALATRIETKDNKVWFIHLRKGVKFHNGREMTAEDVKINFDWRVKTPEGWKPVKFKELVKYLKSAEVVDKYTVKITLEKPFSPLRRILTYAMRGIGPGKEVAAYGKKKAPPIGTGPFKVVEIKPKERIVLERFDDYWGPRPYIDKVVYHFIRSDDTRLIALEKGELDISQIDWTNVPVIKKNPKLDYRVQANPFILQKYYFNFRHWPGNDIRFRKAMWMGAQWEQIAKNSQPGKMGIPARTLLEHSDFFNPEALKLVPPYNPEEAKKLIKAVEKDAGKKIPPIFWLDGNSPMGRNVAEMAKLQLAEIGVNLNLQLLDRGMWFNKILRDPKFEYDLAGYGVGFGLDPTMGFMYFATNSGVAIDGKSLGGYSNPELDSLLEKVEASSDKDAILKYMQEGEKVLLKDVASLPMLINQQLIGFNKKVKGVQFNNTGHIYPTNTWANMWIEE
jgi:peptide/nickel transport system substrate-binding protein